VFWFYFAAWVFYHVQGKASSCSRDVVKVLIIEALVCHKIYEWILILVVVITLRLVS
jgi:hypothetical protein